MKGKLRKILCILLFAIILIQGVCYAHSGRTDKYGGHKDNKNASGLGSYHYHCGGHPAHLHPNGVCPYATNSSSTKNTNTSTSIVQTPTVTPTTIEVQKVDLQNKNTVSELMVGDSFQLIAAVQPQNASNKAITWESSNNNIATVNSNGSVTAVSEGEVTIVAKSNNSKQDSVKILIKRKPVLVEKIIVNDSNFTMSVGDEIVPNTTISPENADDKKFIISSSNPNVIKAVDNKLQAISSGEATIIIVSNDKNASTSFKVEAIDVTYEQNFNENTIKQNSENFSNVANNSNNNGKGFVTYIIICGVIGIFLCYITNKRKK